jgi:hypothetical protein
MALNRFIISIALLSIAYAPAQAATGPQQYAYQAELTLSSQQLQRVALPIEILLALTRTDLGDIEVFDVSGNPLPLSVLKALPKVSEHQLDLPVHEFSSFQERHSKIVTTREQSQQAGQLSELKTTETITTQQERKVYLIELGSVPAGIDRIELKWTHQPASQLLKVKLEIGNELDKLRVIDARKSLTNLDTDNSAWRSIDGIPQRQKYLRITPAKSVTAFELLQVTAHYKQSISAPKPGHRLDSSKVSIDGRDYYNFEMPSVIFAEALQIIPGETHSMISGDLYASLDSVKNKRRIRRGFSQHNISDDEVKPSDPLKLPQRAYAQMWFTSKNTLSAAPAIKLTYPAYEIIFLGNSNGPYSLAWGNHASQTRINELSEILEGEPQQQGELVYLKEVQIAGGLSRLSPELALPWQKWLLWALLVLAVGVTGKMAITLYREMNRDQAT